MGSYQDRIRSRVLFEPESGCWIWRASRGTKGYGQMWFKGRLLGAHRASYRAFVGPIPDGFHIDHICGNKLCVNPTHLQAITAEENVRLQSARRSRCPNGHEYTPDNTRWYRGYRRCCACQRANDQKKIQRAASSRRAL